MIRGEITGLKVTGEGQGLAGHAGAVLLRKLADQAGLTAAPGSALTRAGKFPLVDRGVAPLGEISGLCARAERGTRVEAEIQVSVVPVQYAASPSASPTTLTLTDSP